MTRDDEASRPAPMRWMQRLKRVFHIDIEHCGVCGGMHPARSFEDAWKRAGTIIGPNPVTVVAPTYWSKRIFKFAVNGSGPA